MTTNTTNATNVRLSKDERAKKRAEQQKSPAFTNMKVKVNAKNELVITVPMAEFEHKKLVDGGLSDVETKYGTTKNGNVLFGASYDYVGIEKEGFEHIKFNLSMISSNRDIKQEIADNAKKAEMKAISESATTNSAPSMDMAEYQEFLEFKKWKAALAQQQK